MQIAKYLFLKLRRLVTRGTLANYSCKVSRARIRCWSAKDSIRGRLSGAALGGLPITVNNLARWIEFESVSGLFTVFVIRIGKISVCVVAFLLTASSALSDRHCAPVLERYFEARSEILKPHNDCPNSLQDALHGMADAAVEAGVCGCNILQFYLNAVIEDVNSVGRTCPDKQTLLLELDSELFKEVEACH